MSSDQAPRPPRQMTRQQLRTVVHKIARTYLEIERGLRPPGHLEPLLTDNESRRHRITHRGTTGPAGPVRPHDIGPIHLAPQTPGWQRATLRVRDTEGHWSALVLDLTDTGRGWKIDRLDRLERLIRPPQQIEPEHGHHLDRRIRQAQEERLLATAALQRITDRLDAIGDQRTRPARQLKPHHDHWTRRVEELDQELQTLTRTRDLRQVHNLTPDPPRGDQEQISAPDDLTTDLLGQRPTDADAGRLWDHAAEHLYSYQQRWGPLDAGPADTSDGEQTAARHALIETLRDTVRDLRAQGHGPQLTQISRQPDMAQGIDL